MQNLKRNELITLYVGGFADELDGKAAAAAIKASISFMEGKSFKTPDILLKGKCTFKPFSLEEEEEEEEPPARRNTPTRTTRSRPAIRASSGDSNYEGESETDLESETTAAVATAPPPPKPAPPESSGGARRMTPMYSVPVTNELFHNGNVEAWKKIIQSYEMKYPTCEVSVFYEGEKIHDINTLFKWGKVKHGSTILFAILGTEIKDIAKLQRYLRQGASSEFEAFLKFPVNTVLKLF